MQTSLDERPAHLTEFSVVRDFVQRTFDKVSGERLFTTDVPDLFETYLAAFPEHERQTHRCNCCRQFILRYGHLVTIDELGHTASVMWRDRDEALIGFEAVFAALNRAVRKAKVNGVFISDEKHWGTPTTGEWNHFAVTPPKEKVHRDRLNTPYQVMAQKKQDFGTLSRALAEFNKDLVAQALNLLDSEVLFRAEKVRGPARFLFALHAEIEANEPRHRQNLIWKAVATAPVGFCTPRSSMIGTLLEDLAAGMSFESVSSRFKEKMNPTQYQRPQAAPNAGNIAQAEKLVEQMGIANSLKRRYARLDEVQTIWRPTPKPEKAASGVFGHLLEDQKPKALMSKAGMITWSKFAAKVLPEAEKIQMILPYDLNSFCGVLTAVDMDAPPIIQWDQEDARNPVSWYVYGHGSTPGDWGLPHSTAIDVTGIMLKPSMWAGEDAHPNQGKGAIFILDGARDQNPASQCLFPEILKSQLHSIRSTIEAFSKKGTPEGREDGNANGLMLRNEGALGARVIVTTALGVTEYRIDRWD